MVKGLGTQELRRLVAKGRQTVLAQFLSSRRTSPSLITHGRPDQVRSFRTRKSGLGHDS